MSDKLKELEELKLNLEAMQRFHGSILKNEPTVAHHLDDAVREARCRFKCVAETEPREQPK